MKDIVFVKGNHKLENQGCHVVKEMISLAF